MGVGRESQGALGGKGLWKKRGQLQGFDGGSQSREGMLGGGDLLTRVTDLGY